MPKTRFSTELIGEFSLTAGANNESRAEKRARVATQLRDRYGRWVEMGRGVKFKVRLPNGKYHSALGPFTGDMTPDGRGYVKVENDPYLPNGDYPVSSDNAQQYVALLTEKELKDLQIELGKDVDGNIVSAREDSSIPNLDDLIAEGRVSGPPTKELRTEISGNEIQDKKISSIATALKAEGRFPIPRQSQIDTWGKTSDVTKGAKLDYAKVYEGMSSEDPDFANNYPTFDNFWKRVVNLAVDNRDQSPNDLNNIPQEMKDINKGYAKHVLNLDPDNGTFTVYRNAINNWETERDSAVGYVTTNENFAWDYNATTRVGEGANGRYEITVKPDEVYGMIGYSQVEDEYGLTIGQGVTYQEGRVKKVGELESPYIAPWYDEAIAEVPRAQGATPFRGHSFVGQYDFLPVSKNPLPGNNLDYFLYINKMQREDFYAKYDELYGEGSYQRSVESGNNPTYSAMQKMVVDLGDGTYGIDITKLDPTGQNYAGSSPQADTSDTSSFVNDSTDNRLKFLSLFQEITGEPFMVHKNNKRNKEVVEESTPAEPVAKKISVSDLSDDTTDFDAQDFMPESDFDKIKFDVSKTPDAEESYALYQYQGPKYEDLNKFARINPNYTKDSENDFLAERFPEEASMINKIDNVFANSKIAEDLTVFRGASISPGRYKELLNLKIGDEFMDSAYLSTSADPLIAKSFSYNELTDDASRVSIIYKINVKAGQPAIRIKDYTTDDILKESEILLARGSTIKVTNLLKTTFDPITEDDESKDVLIIEGDYTPAQAEAEAGAGASPVTDGTSTIKDRKGKTINPGEEVEIAYSIYEVGKGSSNAKKPLKAIFTGYKESDFSAGKGIETKNRAILYVPEQDGTVSGYYGVSSYVLNADPNSDDFKGVGGTSPVDIDGFSEKNALPNPKQMTSLSEQEAEEVIDYTRHKGSFEEINSSLRSNSVGPETQEKIEILDKIIGYNQILEDQEYYRGIPIPLGLTLKEFLNNLDSGSITEIEELGFSSTSTDEKMGSIFANKYFGGGVVLRIKAKAGQSAYYVPKFLAGVIANENEVILPRGIKYRIVSHEFSPQDDKVVLDVEIGQPEPQAQEEELAEEDKLSNLPEVEMVFPNDEDTRNKYNNLKFNLNREIPANGSKAVKIYQEVGFDYINAYLRDNLNYQNGDKTISVEGVGNLGALIDRMDSLLENSRLAEDLEVYRGLALDFEDYSRLINLSEGNSYVDKGYLSTSSDPFVGVKFAENVRDDNFYKVLFKIKAKAGQPALKSQSYTGENYDKENEVIFGRNSTIKITKFSRLTDFKNNILVVEGELVLEDLAQDTDVSGVIDVVDEESTKARIEPGLDNWMPSLFDLLDSLEEDEDGEEITNDERGNILQSKFIEASGYNGKPKLVGQEEFEAIDGETLYRAVTDEKFIDNYINSETQFAGEGTSGNGTYTTNKRQTAEGFAGDTANKKEVIDKRLMEIKLAADANILYLERTSDWRAWIEENKEILLEKAKQFGANPRNIQSILSKLTSTTGWSNYAIMLGYDGFKVSAGNNEYYTIILNRGKVILNDKSRA